ncbi:TIGR02710 family CRISPR-associated CARF protein [Desulfoplanes sp. PS50]
MKILFTTVGGSHEPVIQAVTQLRPDHVVFVCSEGSGSSKSSEEMITGSGNVIKAAWNDEKPSLPNIPAQLSLSPEAFHVIRISPDDLDAAVQRIEQEIESYGHEHELIADYTGGTKTMTAAMVLASLDQRVQLYLVKGARTDLKKVVDGTQCCSRAVVDRVRFDREFRNHLQPWKRFAYGESASGLAAMDIPADSTIQDRHNMARSLSDAFDAWDRFDHHKARRLLMAYRTQTARHYSPYIKALDALCGEHEPAKSEGARIHDLWLNALRCAAASRYDDAISRVYRIIEWVAQWVLRTRCNVDTSDLPGEFIPEHIRIFPNHSGKIQAPLHKAWELVACKTQGPAQQFIEANKDDLRTPLGIRNGSILAHGFTPVTRQDWLNVETWMQEKLILVFREELKRTGLKKVCPQLPNEYVW